MVQAAAKTAVIGCNSLVCCKNVAVFLLFYTIMRMWNKCLIRTKQIGCWDFGTLWIRRPVKYFLAQTDMAL